MFERVVIASGDSTRQVKALADNVQDKVRENGAQVYGVEGEATGEWVLVDLGDVVVHIMHPTIRDFYNLEEVWGGKKVKVASPAAALKEPRPKDPKPKKAKPTKAKPRAKAARPRRSP